MAIDYGSATVRAVLVTSSGTTTLPLDGTGEMSTAVHVGDSGMLTGAAAWRQAAADPAGFVPSPLRSGPGRISAGGTEVEVVDLVAATLRQVAAAAQLAAGEPVDDVRLVVPAGWGPKRRTWLRHAAHAAGLSVSRLVEAPVAALARPRPGALPAAIPGGPVLVLDVGAGAEVTVVHPEPAGGQVLSTLAGPGEGGDRIDTALLQLVTGADPDALPGEQRWVLSAAIQAARIALGEQIAVTMPMPAGQPPVVLGSAQLAEAARPVFERVGELAAQVVDNADLTVGQLGGVYLIGGAAGTPGAAEMVAAKLGVTPELADLPHLAAVLGAADADTPDSGAVVADPLQTPPLRRLITLALPGVLALALYVHFAMSAIYNDGTPRYPQPGYYVLASWGELSVTTVLTMITCLQAAMLFPAAFDLHHADEHPAGQHPAGQHPAGQHPAGQHPAGQGTTGQGSAGRISTGIGLAVAAGLATAALTALTAGVYFNQHSAHLLRWAVLPVLPTAAAATAIAVLTWRRPVSPPAGWSSFLAFPPSATISAAAGIFAVCLWWAGGLPWWLTSWITVIGLAGGLLIGVAIACTLVRHPAGRAALIVPIGFFTTIISRSGPDVLAVMWAIVVACWWTWRAWALARSTPVRH